MSAQVATQRAARELEIVTANLGFTERATSKLFTYQCEPPTGVPISNAAIVPRPVTLANARPVADTFSLDVEGFAVAHHRTAVRDLWDEAQTLALGHPEAADIVKKATGASRVVVFDHTRRRRSSATDGASDPTRRPVVRTHVDQTVDSGPRRVREIMGEQADALLKRRAAIINVWRPIRHTARDWPLALADARSIASRDLLPSDLIFAHRRGEIYALAHNPAQRWYFIPDLAVDEAILIKCWDSDPRVARFAPHTGFEDPTTPPGTPPRESIEFRTIAFFD